MIWVLRSDIILGDLWSGILRNNAYKASWTRKKKESEYHWNDWMTTEMYLPFTRLNGDWKTFQFSQNGGVSAGGGGIYLKLGVQINE